MLSRAKAMIATLCCVDPVNTLSLLTIWIENGLLAGAAAILRELQRWLDRHRQAPAIRISWRWPTSVGGWKSWLAFFDWVELVHRHDPFMAEPAR